MREGRSRPHSRSNSQCVEPTAGPRLGHCAASLCCSLCAFASLKGRATLRERPKTDEVTSLHSSRTKLVYLDVDRRQPAICKSFWPKSFRKFKSKKYFQTSEWLLHFTSPFLG